MEQTPELVMEFSPGKPTQVKVNGVAGPACKAFSRPFEEVIGGKIISRTNTNDMQRLPEASVAEHVQAKKTF